MSLISERFGSRGSWVSSEAYSRQAGAAAIPENARRLLWADPRQQAVSDEVPPPRNSRDLWKIAAAGEARSMPAATSRPPGLQAQYQSVT